MAKKKISKQDAKAYGAKYKKPEKYVKKSFPRPSSELSPSLKDTKEYMIPWIENIYGLFMRKNTWMGSSYEDINTLRAYQEGNQAVTQYRDYIYGVDASQKEAGASTMISADGYDMRDKAQPKHKRMAWVNIDEKPVSIGPKIMSRLIEQANTMYYEIGVNAINSIAVQTEEMQKSRLWFEKQNQEWLQSRRAMAGIQPQEPEFMPANLNELELYAQSGGFKVPYATHMEMLLKHTYNISDWDKEVREKVLKDLSAFRYAMVREYYDPEEKRVKAKYVDPKFGGMQFSKDFSFKDTEYGYELEYWPISKIRQKFDLSFEEAAGLAYAYSGELGNPSYSDWDNYGYFEQSDHGYGFDFYKIPVFRCEWIDLDNERYYKHKTKNGRTFNKPLKSKDPEGLEVYDNRVRYVREGTWVVGTDLLCNHGKVKNMVRNNPKKPRISYRGIRLGMPALFQQIRPFLDGLTLSWWKTQQAISISISNGIAVDIGALKNISIGKDKSWDATQVLQYYRQQGIFLYKRNNPMGFNTGGGSPIQALKTDMENNIKAQFEMMNQYMMIIEQISGISLLAQTTPEPRVGKFNMQVAMQGTNQIINSVIRAATELQADLGINLMCKIRSLCKNNKPIRESYESVIGKAKMKVIMDAEKTNVEYGLKVEARDITDMRMFIEEILLASAKGNMTGEVPGLLDPSEILMVRDMLEQRQNIRFITLTLGYMLQRKGKEAQAQKERLIELQGEQTRKAAVEQARTEQGKQQFEMDKITKQFEADYMLKYDKHPAELMQRAMQAGQPPQAPGQSVPTAPEQQGMAGAETPMSEPQMPPAPPAQAM